MKYDPACIFPSGQQPKAEPMLSDAEVMRIITDGYPARETPSFEWTRRTKKVRDWYEAKIASGELMVVRTAKRISFGHKTSYHNGEPDDACSACEGVILGRHVKYCPNCGAKIIN